MSIRSTFARLSTAAVLVLVGANASSAQRVEPIAASSRSMSTDAHARQSTQAEGERGRYLTWGGVGGGIVGGGAGLFGGMLLGVTLAHTHNCSGEDCSLGQALLGAVVGEALGVAVGAHLGSASRGDLGLAVLSSAAIGVVGVFASIKAEKAAGPILIAVPLLQLAAVLALER